MSRRKFEVILDTPPGVDVNDVARDLWISLAALEATDEQQAHMVGRVVEIRWNDSGYRCALTTRASTEEREQ